MNVETAPKLKTLEQSVEFAKTDSERVDALCALADALCDEDSARALRLAEEAEQLAADASYLPGLARSLNLAGYCAWRLADHARAVDLMRRGRDVSRQVGDRALEAKCLYDLGRTLRRDSDYPGALDAHRQALALYEALGDVAGQGDALNDTGNVHYDLGDHGKALSCYLDSLKLRETLADRSAVGCSFNNIANVYSEVGDHARSAAYLERCLAISRETGATRLEARCQGNLAITYSDLGRFEEAVETSRAALEIARREGLRSDECQALMGWAKTHQKRERHADAVPLYLEALGIALAISDRCAQCEIHALLGQAYLETGHPAEALAALSGAAEMAETLGMSQFASSAFRSLSEVCEREGDCAAALTHHKRFHALEKQAFDRDVDKRVRTLMAHMRLEEAQKETEVHRQHNHELRAVNEMLRQADRDKSLLLEQLRQQAEELQAQADELARQAREDGLTGLYNRRSVEGWLAHAFAEARRYERPLTVAIGDVDHFKQVNDHFGHQTGDLVLRTVASLLRRACRAADVVGRWGGEEFVLVLPETGAEAARLVCEKVRRTVQSHPWHEVHPDLRVTLSLGLATESGCADYEGLLSLADSRLYEAKKAGRNRVCADS